MLITARPQMMSLRYSMDEILPKFRAAGFEGYEFCLEDKLFHVRPDLLEDGFIRHLVACSAEQNQTIASIGCHVDFVQNDDAYAVIRKGVQKTRQFGTDIFIIASGSAQSDTEDPEATSRFRTRLDELLNIADASGVRVALEPEPGHRIDTTQSFLDLWADTDRKSALFCNFDIGHAYLLDSDIPESIRALGDRIAHGHIENMANKTHLHLVPWEGEIDLGEVLQELQAIGFDGALAFDFYNDAYEAIMPKVAEHLKKLRDESCAV